MDEQEPFMDNEPRFPEMFWLFLVLIMILFGLLCSCKTKYVSVPEYHTIIVNKHDTLIQRDSIYKKDSIFMWKEGDTIWKEKFSIIYKDRWRDKIVYRDSLRVDSIRVPYPVYVEKKKTLINKIESYIGKISLLAILLIASFYIFKYIKRRGI